MIIFLKMFSLLVSFLFCQAREATTTEASNRPMVTEAQGRYSHILNCQLAIKEGYSIRNKPWRLCNAFMYSNQGNYKDFVFLLLPDRVETHHLRAPGENENGYVDYEVRIDSTTPPKWIGFKIDKNNGLLESCGGGGNPEDALTKPKTKASLERSVNVEELYGEALSFEISSIDKKFIKNNLLHSDEARAQLKKVFCDCQDFQRVQSSLQNILSNLSSAVASMQRTEERETMTQYLSELEGCSKALISGIGNDYMLDPSGQINLNF